MSESVKPQAAHVSATTEKMGVVEKLGFMTFSMSDNIVYQFKAIYYMFFLTNVLGISVGTAGTVFAIGTVWDAVNDPLLGYMALNTRFKSGEKIRPFILYAVPWAVTIVALFWAWHPLRVESVEFNDRVVDGVHYYSANINGNYWLSSVGGESELLTHVGPNDDYYYVAAGTDTLPVDKDVSFYDYAEPPATWVDGKLEPLVVPYEDIADYFGRDLIGLTAEIRGGKIVSMQREWHP